MKILIEFIMLWFIVLNSNVSPGHIIENPEVKLYQESKDSIKKVLELLDIRYNFFEDYQVFNENDRSLKPEEYVNSLNIWQLDINTKDMRQLTFDGGYESPVISPDRLDLCYIKEGAIFTKNIESGQVRKIVEPQDGPTYIIHWADHGIILFLGDTHNTIYKFNTSSRDLTSDSYDTNIFNKVIEISRVNQSNNTLIYDDIHENDWNLLLKPKESLYAMLITEDNYQDRDPSWINKSLVLFVSNRLPMK